MPITLNISAVERENSNLKYAQSSILPANAIAVEIRYTTKRIF
jgi:hypothetical protein